MEKLIIGSLESCNLPELSIYDLQIRVDTGAKTSSLHVDNIRRYRQGGKPWVKFDIHPDVYNVNHIVECASRLHDIRTIKSSNGVSEERYVIKTPIQLGQHSWPIEITLTNRSDMNYLMLLGREGMGDKVLVDPSETFILSSEN
ncbi:ATP-dependent zinc protease [Halioxenophilus sp. WMMB6]|uniref:ATP-dependent zinc protease family protein n=1 Tax=Halioxenophilus sp. WMMB6 TaxID=3073815 RepID=UPI00295EC977|nr:RimK/LysX family protein [Halioxenophilus sp. WMMB6]